MHVMHGPSVSGYAMVLTILSPVMGQIASLSCGGLGEVTDYGKKIQTENPVYMSTKNNEKQSYNGCTVLVLRVRGLHVCLGTATITCKTKPLQRPLPKNKMVEGGLIPYKIMNDG